LAQFTGCLFLEWGWGFLILIGIGVLLFVGALVLLIKLVGMPQAQLAGSGDGEQAGSGDGEVEAKGLTLRGPLVRVVLIVGAVVVIVYFISKGYDGFKDSYSVAWDSPSDGVELQTLRDKFQGDTQATIVINEPAKKFSVIGSYEGACVQDMFTSICRKYAPKLSCSTLWLKRTLVVDLAQAK